MASKSVDAPQASVPNAVAAVEDPSASTPTGAVEVASHNADTVEKPAQVEAATPRPAEKFTELGDDGDQPAGVRVIALGEKFIEELGDLDVADLTADLKRNLRHTLDDVAH